MKKLSVVACSAFAALMFVACSDDSVTAAVPPAGGGAGQGSGVALDSTRNSSDVAQSSSSIEVASSSSDVAESSSAAEDPSRVIVSDAVAQCEDRRTFDARCSMVLCLQSRLRVKKVMLRFRRSLTAMCLQKMLALR